MLYLRSFKCLVIVGMALLGSSVSSVNAAIISGSHMTNGGKTVALQGLEWLSFDVTVNVSRTQIEADHGGLLSAGWAYATREQTSILLQSLWGGTVEGWAPSNADGAQWINDHLAQGGPLQPSGFSVFSDFHFGSEGECIANPTQECRGHWRGRDTDGDGGFDDGWFRESTGLNAALFNPALANAIATDLQTGPQWASMLVRPSAVPVPAAAWLFGSALIGLAGLRRHRKTA